MIRKLYTGENLAVMQGLDADIADLIYLDPPFNSNRDYGQFDDKWNADYILRETIVRSDLSDLFEVIDKVHSTSMMAYIAFMSARLQECKRLLKPNGSIYLHCDPTASHYLKLVMDAIFGVKNYRNEIIWSYGKWSNAATMFQKNHDTILYYALSKATFNMQEGFSDNKLKCFEKGFANNTNNGIKTLVVYDKEKAAKEMERSCYHKIAYVGKKGTAMSDSWDDISYINSQSKERCGYPTQKPLKLLERIVQASTNYGSLVFDPFCGSGTTLLAAEKYGCNWIGIDKNDNAGLLEERAIQTFGELTFDYDHITNSND